MDGIEAKAEQIVKRLNIELKKEIIIFRHLCRKCNFKFKNEAE